MLRSHPGYFFKVQTRFFPRIWGLSGTLKLSNRCLDEGGRGWCQRKKELVYRIWRWKETVNFRELERKNKVARTWRTKRSGKHKGTQVTQCLLSLGKMFEFSYHGDITWSIFLEGPWWPLCGVGFERGQGGHREANWETVQ